jgi:hypothetical protein
MTRQPPKGAGRAGMKLRCAIYTRKSGEEGPEQDFNSLDAQREACECQTASNFDPSYCLICECYPGGAVGADGPARTDLLSLSTSKACSKGGAVGGSGHA